MFLTEQFLRLIGVNKVEYYTHEMAGSGQDGICGKCKKSQTSEGHDGCLGTLPSSIGKIIGPIMNACCGHGNNTGAYIQYWSRFRISGDKAVSEQSRLIATNMKR